MKFAVLETSRLSIRRFVTDDLTDLVDYRLDPVVALYQDWDLEWSLADAKRYLEYSDEPKLGTQGEWTQLAIVDRTSGRLCGDIGIHFIEAQPSTVEVGITMSRAFQGLGLAAEAMRSVVSWLFAEFDLHRVFAHVDERNVSARGLLTSLGFRQEAELREADWFKGEWTTLCVYAVLAGEWPRRPTE
jgi:RimJ/RimL family protein N-acetyltransferase